MSDVIENRATWSHAVQYVDDAVSEKEAKDMLWACFIQVDYLGGRVLAPTYFNGWRVQALFEDCEHDLPLPDGCRRVVVPPSLWASL